MKQLNVSITPHFAKFISGKVRSGRYSNASEVVREALRRFEHDEQIREQNAILEPDHFQETVEQGLASIRDGDDIPIGSDRELRQFFADIDSRGRKRMAASKRRPQK
jgi:antitoxin ParD1/3/4